MLYTYFSCDPHQHSCTQRLFCPHFTDERSEAQLSHWLRVAQLAKGQSQHWIQSIGCTVVVLWAGVGGGALGLQQVDLASEQEWPLFLSVRI